MLRALLFLLLAVINIAPAAADGYRSKDLAEAAAQYRQALIAAVPAEQRQPELISQLRRDADADPARSGMRRRPTISAAPSPTAPMTGSSGCGSRRTSSPPATTTSSPRPTTPISNRPIRPSVATPSF